MNRTQWILLAAAFGLYLLFGAVVIMHLEAPAEEANLEELRDLQNVIYDELIASDAVNQTEREEIWIRIAEMINQPTLIRNGSLPNKKWSVYNSFFVAVTAVTTIGYGHLSPSTVSGKVFCIFFSLVGIPLNGILFVTLGDYFGAKIAEKKEKQKRSGQRGSTGWIAALMYLLYYFIPGTIIFLAVPAGLFTYMEGWDYMDSFYYAYISLTTIGFGDLVAGHQGITVYGHWAWLYRSFIIIWIFFGLAYFVMVISIITKVIRSTPVAVLEKKVSERFRRATRISLAKDGLLLRQLINQIQLTKIQPVYKSRKGHRTESQPAFFLDGETCQNPSLTLHQQDRMPNTLKGCLSDTALGFIDVEATFHNKHRAFSKDDAVDSSGITDPMQLLTRLADALCNNESDEEEDMIIMKKLGALSADSSRSQYLSRSSLARASLSVVEDSRPASNKLSDLDINLKPKDVLHEQVTSRRSFRHPRSRRLSETRNPNVSHNPFNYSTYRDSIRNQCRLAFDAENKEVQPGPRRMFNRSVSESNAPPRQVRFNWPSLNNNAAGANNSITENPSNEEKSTEKASVAEFCDLLDRVQISSQNNVSSPEQ